MTTATKHTPTPWKLHIESSTPVHTTIRVFANGASAGLLTLRNDEFTELRRVLDSHAALVAALREIAAHGPYGNASVWTPEQMENRARAVLASIEEQS